MNHDLKKSLVLAAAAALGLSATACGGGSTEAAGSSTTPESSSGQASCSSGHEHSGGQASCSAATPAAGTTEGESTGGGQASCSAGAGGGQAQGVHHRPGRVLQRPREGLREGLGVGRVLAGQRGDAAQVAQQPANRRGEHVPRGARALLGDRQVARRRDARCVVGCAWCHGIASEDTVRP